MPWSIAPTPALLTEVLAPHDIGVINSILYDLGCRSTSLPHLHYTLLRIFDWRYHIKIAVHLVVAVHILKQLVPDPPMNINLTHCIPRRLVPRYSLHSLRAVSRFKHLAV